jgi:radical SAM superfamily enzyme YgiQ (UPF0313 family)
MEKTAKKTGVTLIYPGITESGFASRKGNEGTWINHGLCLISAVLKKAGHEVGLIDLRRLGGWEDLAGAAERRGRRIFGITVMSVDYNAVTKCAEILKKKDPGAKIIVGGFHPTIAPQEFESNPNIDHIFLGEAEITFPRVVRALGSGERVDRVIRGETPDLEELPFANRELFEGGEEPFVAFLRPPFVTLIAGRGCAYNCRFCQPAERIMFGKQVRRRSVDNVIAELDYLRRTHNFNSMMIHDDCLTEDPDWVWRFAEGYRKNGFTQPFVCQSRPDLIVKNRKMVRELKKAGLVLLIIGFESGSQRMLDFLRRGHTLEDSLEAAEICRRERIKIWANYMLGLPTETREEQRETVEMIKEIKPYHCSPAYYTPHPGSDLFRYCEENRLSLISNHDDYRRNTYNPKIKGVDYEYLDQLLRESISVGEDQNRLTNGMKRIVPSSLKRYWKKIRGWGVR